MSLPLNLPPTVSIPSTWLIGLIASDLVLLLICWILAFKRNRAPGGGIWETRVERVDILWFPTITYSNALKKVVKAAPGIPHCRPCAKPLSMAKDEKGGWVCGKCGNRFAESISDVGIVDMVLKQAVGYFLERHQDFKA